MILAIDSGNTRVKWALADEQGAFSGLAAADRGASLAQLGDAAGQASAACGCDVAGPERRKEIEGALAGVPCAWIEARAEACGVLSRYRPGQLGADRWCALLGLRSSCGWGLAVMAGTAVTVDALQEDGEFRGGLILPGRRLMHESLARAARLPQVPSDAPAPDPSSTAAAIAAGSLHAAAGAVLLFARRVQFEDAPLVLCGGDAGQLAALLPGSRIDAHLVLRGALAAYGAQA